MHTEVLGMTVHVYSLLSNGEDEKMGREIENCIYGKILTIGESKWFPGVHAE